jgi:hypothetical protein
METILAIITINREAVLEGGGTPVFYALNKEEQERLSLVLSKILKGMIHDLENGVYLIVQH